MAKIFKSIKWIYSQPWSWRQVFDQLISPYNPKNIKPLKSEIWWMMMMCGISSIQFSFINNFDIPKNNYVPSLLLIIDSHSLIPFQKLKKKSRLWECVQNIIKLLLEHVTVKYYLPIIYTSYIYFIQNLTPINWTPWFNVAINRYLSSCSYDLNKQNSNDTSHIRVPYRRNYKIHPREPFLMTN